jgi:uncharacterized protein YbjT (DUF2867 family)
MTDTILVTGATGTVGRPLVEQLLADGHRVRALTRDPGRAQLPPGADVVRGDLDHPGTLDGVFTGVDAVHLITFGADYQPLADAPEIVERAVTAGVRRATVLRGDVTLGPVEKAVAASSLRWTYLSPVEFMSNMLEWAEAVRTEGVVREGFADARAASVHPADIAAVAAVALTADGHGGRDYWLTGPEPLTPRDKTRIIGEVLGRPVRFEELTRDQVVERWRAQGYDDETVEWFLGMLTDPPISGDTVLPTVPDVTGRPARTFAQWVRENAAAFVG